MRNRITIENAKGYSTEKNLYRALEKYHLTEYHRHVVCRKPDGNWTAVFVINQNEGGYIAAASAHGFVTL